MKIDVCGVGFDNVTMTEAVDRAMEILDGSETCYAVTPNAEIVWEAMHDEGLCRLINEAALVLPDGAGVVLGARMLGTPLREKVAGIEFGGNLMAAMARTGRRLYLLGGKPGVAEEAAEKCRAKYPGLQIVGTGDGYFRDEGPVLEKINASGAEAVIVCLGAPKQERFMRAHQQDLPQVRFMVGLGGSLDGFAGRVKRAPRWMIRCNLEWLYRLIKEPRRIGRMMRLPKFVLAVRREARRKAAKRA